MESIQRFCCQNKSYLEPVLFFGASFLAGRFIQYFPDTCQTGLFVSSGLASLATCAYNQTMHDESHSFPRTLLGKAAAIALANIGTTLIAKPLNDKGLFFSPTSALKLGAMQCVLSTVVSATTATDPEKTIQKEHKEFDLNPWKWHRLSAEEQAEKVKAFMKAGILLPIKTRKENVE